MQQLHGHSCCGACSPLRLHSKMARKRCWSAQQACGTSCLAQLAGSSFDWLLQSVHFCYQFMRYLAVRKLVVEVSKKRRVTRAVSLEVQAGAEAAWCLSPISLKGAWPEQPPPIGAFVQTKCGLRCKVVGAVRRLSPGLLHSALMSVSYAQVAKRGIWHCLRLYHRSKISLLSSEMFAEHVGSVMRYVEKRHCVGRALSVPSLIDAVSLRLLRLTGGMENLSFLMSALQEHFAGKRFHFFLGSAYRKRKLSEQEQTCLGPSPCLSRLRSTLQQACDEDSPPMFARVSRPVGPPRQLRCTAGPLPSDFSTTEWSEELWQELGELLKVFHLE